MARSPGHSKVTCWSLLDKRVHEKPISLSLLEQSQYLQMPMAEINHIRTNILAGKVCFDNLGDVKSHPALSGNRSSDLPCHSHYQIIFCTILHCYISMSTRARPCCGFRELQSCVFKGCLDVAVLCTAFLIVWVIIVFCYTILQPFLYGNE